MKVTAGIVMALFGVALIGAATTSAVPASADATSSLPVSGDPFRGAAATIAAIPRVLDAANIDSFIVTSLAAGDPVSASEECLRPDKSIGPRTTPLTSSLFSAAAIDQRERLIRALEAYEALRVAVANDAATGHVSAIAAEYRAALARLEMSAAVHGPGDLFTDEAAPSLDAADSTSIVRSLAKHVTGSIDRATLKTLVASQHAAIAKLIVIAFDDASAYRAQAESVTSQLADQWQAYGGRAPAPNVASSSIDSATTARRALPPCSEVLSRPVPASPTPHGAGTESSLPVSPWVREEIDAATAQHRTLLAIGAPLGAFFAALSTVNETPDDDASALQAAFDRFAAAAQQIAETGAPLR